MTDTNTLEPTDAPDLLQIARSTGLRSHLQGVSATDARALLKAFVDALPPAPVSEPYAYEFSRSNGDGTHSVHIERGSLQEVVPGRWEHVGPPKDALVDTSIKALYTTPQTQPAAVPAQAGEMSEQDCGLLEQAASMLDALANDERNRGNCSTAEGADRSAYVVRRLASALLASAPAQPVAHVSQETFNDDGTSDIIIPALPIGMALYAAPQPAAQAGWCDGCSPDNCGGCMTSAAPAQAAPVDAQHSTACLYHYALSRLGLRDSTGLRVLFWDAHNSLSWDSKTDWYVTPDADKADCGQCNAAIAAQQGDKT